MLKRCSDHQRPTLPTEPTRDGRRRSAAAWREKLAEHYEYEGRRKVTTDKPTKDREAALTPNGRERERERERDSPPCNGNRNSKEEKEETMAIRMVRMGAERLQFYLAEHPVIVSFRWTGAHSWGSTWSFLFSSIAAYLAIALFLNLLLIKRRRPVPLGPLPALHSLAVALVSLTIFLGLSVSTAAEIRDTRWLWSRSKTPIQWLLCFPLGTRPSGRVFFWSYAFYISRFLLLLRTVFSIFQRRPLTFFRLFHHSILIFMSFLWLEFSQSFQVVAILASTLIYSVMYGYRFWTGVGWPASCFPVVGNCQMVLLGCYIAAHVGVLLLHFRKEGCNGIGAWVFNSFLNGALLLLFLNFYVRKHLHRCRTVEDVHHRAAVTDSESSELELKKDV